jgi:hypothetical protein
MLKLLKSNQREVHTICNSIVVNASYLVCIKSELLFQFAKFVTMCYIELLVVCCSELMSI